jgi:hypothetical protein
MIVEEGRVENGPLYAYLLIGISQVKTKTMKWPGYGC